MRDVIIIGGGIAASTAGIYTARAGMDPLVISGKGLDQLSLTTLVENYPGFPEGVMGPELVANCRKQAEKFGAEYIGEDVDSFEIKKGENGVNMFVVGVGEKKYDAKSVIICTGASARRMEIPGENDYFGKGVSTCAVCDAALYKDKDVVVVGGGDSAMEEALALYKFSKKVVIVHRRDEFRASKIMQERVLKLKDKIEVVWDSAVSEVLGDGKFVTGVKIKNVKNGNVEEVKCDGMFLAIGHVPNTKIFDGNVGLDGKGYVITDKFGKTNVEGIYAGGDCQDPMFKQAVTSAGTSCMAGLNAEKYIEELKAKEKY